MLEYRSVSRAGVFRIQIDLSRQQRIVWQISAQLELAFNCNSACFEHLSNDLSKQPRLGEVFGAHHDACALGLGTMRMRIAEAQIYAGDKGSRDRSGCGNREAFPA